MRTVLKHIVAHTYKPWLVKYLSRNRIYRYDGIELEIPTEVFHPGFFNSTHLLLQRIRRLPLKGQRLLELGAGSGLISMEAARQGACVTSSDINRVAIEYLKLNSNRNGIEIRIIESDLFRSIPPQQFDIIAINPPYYMKEPKNLIDQAWYCGENGEYFSDLFEQLMEYIHPASKVLMVCCDGCNLEMIHQAAIKNGFKLTLDLTRQYILEKNFIFKIELEK